MAISSKGTREHSTIAFPYVDLEATIVVARAMLNAGAGQLSRDQVAGLMDTTISSGSFLNKLSATRMFGLIMMGAGKCELTELGFSILDKDETRQKAARTEAFLNIPLFKRVFEEFRGRQLPPRPQGLEQAFVKMGVANNQRSTARYTFDRSAEQAGFFMNGPDRLIEPIIPKHFSGNEVPGSVAETQTIASPASVQASAMAGLHPFIQGLIDALPERGEEWPVDERIAWLQAAANNFALMYKGAGKISVGRG